MKSRRKKNYGKLNLGFEQMIKGQKYISAAYSKYEKFQSKKRKNYEENSFDFFQLYILLCIMLNLDKQKFISWIIRIFTILYNTKYLKRSK